MNKLRNVVQLLLEGKPLPREFGDHPLKGEWHQSRDLHIESNWILIYCIEENAIRFDRTGTHSDIFRN